MNATPFWLLVWCTTLLVVHQIKASASDDHQLSAALKHLYDSCNQSSHHCVGISNRTDCLQQNNCDVLVHMQVLPTSQSRFNHSESGRYCFYYQNAIDLSSLGGHAQVSARLGSNSSTPQLELNCVFHGKDYLDHFQVAYLRNASGTFRVRLEPGVQPVFVSGGNWPIQDQSADLTVPLAIESQPDNVTLASGFLSSEDHQPMLAKYCCFEQPLKLTVTYEQQIWPLSLNTRSMHATLFYRNTIDKLKFQNTSKFSLIDDHHHNHSAHLEPPSVSDHLPQSPSNGTENLDQASHHPADSHRRHRHHHHHPLPHPPSNETSIESNEIQLDSSSDADKIERAMWAWFFICFVLLCFLLVIAITLYNLFVK